MAGLTSVQAAYVEAKDAAYDAKSKFIDAEAALYRELLTQKGIEEEQVCEVVDKNGKTFKGVFRILKQTDAAVLRFYPYKKDATLSLSAKAYYFGIAPHVCWEATIVTSVTPCDPPEPHVEDTI